MTADDKSHRGGTDRSRVSGSEGYEVDYFDKKHGNNRKERDAAAERLKGGE